MLWDWLQLLIVPAALAYFGLWYSDQQSIADRRHTDELQYLAQQQSKQLRQQDLLTASEDRIVEIVSANKFDLADAPQSAQDFAQAIMSRAFGTVSVASNGKRMVLPGVLDASAKGAFLQFLVSTNHVTSQNAVLSLSSDLLDNIDVTGLALPEINLSGASLQGAQLQGSNLDGADLASADFTKAQLEGAFLEQNIDASNGIFTGAHLHRAHLEGLDATGAHFNGADLSGADLTCVQFSNATLDGANVAGATVSQSQLDQAGSMKSLKGLSTIKLPPPASCPKS
jgi:uncharacterized protein YjbI with pentapeptide repeats